MATGSLSRPSLVLLLLLRDLVLYGILFALCGVFIAAEDTLESAVAAEMIEESCRGLGFGALATMNGIGDLASSILIGFIWAFVGYSAGFMFAAIVAAAGTIMMFAWANGKPDSCISGYRFPEMMPKNLTGMKKV